MGIIKSGKVVVILAGRFAGRKAVVVNACEEGKDNKKFGHCIVAGIDRHPRKVVRAMSKAKMDKRCKMKPFVKAVNFNHIMPTRYSVDFDLKKLADGACLHESNRVETRKAVKKVFEERYKNQSSKSEKKTIGVAYFFNKLRF